ncbi:MAG: DUF885 family protein, partial [Candidatus Glassbacteria bacterium]|nr:DUF885 family protein [Candidatus Glassbacteria bacterium]
MSSPARKNLTKEAEAYLAYLAGAFPVMSATDEFLFFPLVEDSYKYRSSMENLSAELIGDALRRAGRALEVAGKSGKAGAGDLDLEIDSWLLRMHAENFIRTFEVEQEHLSDPSLYFRTAAHGLALVAGDPSCLAGRIRAAAGLFHVGAGQLTRSSPQKAQQGLAWAANFKAFLAGLARALRDAGDSPALDALDRLGEEADRFARRIERLDTTGGPEALGSERYSLLIRGAFGLKEDPPRLYELLQQERARLAARLYAGAIRQGYRADQWRLAAVDSPPPDLEAAEPVEIYRAELERLARWLASRLEAGDIDTGEVPEVRVMPAYLKGLRASASYAAPVGRERRGIFFVGFTGERGSSAARLALHSDYRYITVHETFPGHHHLDTVRRKLKPAIRAQSENALFYEGWSC